MNMVELQRGVMANGSAISGEWRALIFFLWLKKERSLKKKKTINLINKIGEDDDIFEKLAVKMKKIKIKIEF